MSSGTKKLLILYTCGSLLLFGFYIFFYVHIQSMEEATHAAIIEARQLQQRSDELTNLNSVVRNIDAKKKALGGFFVASDREQFVQFLEDIEAIGDSSGASVSVKPVGDADMKGVVDELGLDLFVEGSWSDVYYFLTLLENFPMKLTITGVSFNEQPDEETWRGTVSIKVLQINEPS